MKKVKSLLSLILAVLMVAGCLATASAADAKVEAEPNGTAATATAFNAGEEITGKLEDAADEDYFKFTAAKAGNATVTFKHTANSATSTYFTVEIKDAEKTLATFTSAGNSASESAVISVAKDATYYVVVTKGDIHDATLGYSVTVAVEEVALSESEPNDKVAEADVLEYSPSGNPKEYYGSIGAGDVDYYKVAIPSDGVINLYLYNYAANAGDYTAIFYTYLEEGGLQVLRPVTSIDITKAETSKTGASVGIAKGEYYLVIKGATDSSTGSYKTRVLFRNADNLETEWNDTTATADVIAFGKTYKATLDEKTDKDYFKFTAPANNKGYDFEFVSTNAGDWTFKILNSDGINVVDPVALKATNDSKTAKAETNPLAEGTYYIEVTFAGEVHDAGYYDIKVTEKAEAIGGDNEEEKNLFDRIGALNWGGLWDNFAGWIEQINFMGLLSSIFGSIVKVFTYLGSMA